MDSVSLSPFTWRLRAVDDCSAAPAAVRGPAIPATVPGCVHLDLLRAGLIPDPALAQNELLLQWIGETDWEYSCSFNLEAATLAHDRLDLVCEGLDTIAELSLNGVPIGSAANAHHPHRFDLRAAARPGTNELSIVFRSPLHHIRAAAARLGPRPVNGDWDPYIFIRKPACNFGWDFAPKLATCGITKPICIEAWTHARIASVVTRTTRHDRHRWQLEIDVDVEWASPMAFADSLSVGACLTDASRLDEWDHKDLDAGRTQYALSMRVNPPQLWHIAGHGPQRLYDLDVTIYGSDEAWGIAHSCRRSVAFREVALDTAPDAPGNRFALSVNGTPVFCKGANWVPEGLFPGLADDATVRARVQQAADAGFNMLRVWGGGVYESDAFYDACDELGILVWQDFMFACAMYPEEAPYPQLIEAEARYQITRLSSHPCLTLWCGGNECTWAHESWGNAPGERPWKDRVGDNTWGHAYYFDLLPRLVQELAPTTPYWPNSPWPGRDGLGGNSPHHGDRHTWDLRVDQYTTQVPRFLSEFGHQSPSNIDTLRKALGPEALALNSPALNHRQRATGGTAKHIDESLTEWFAPPRDFEEWHYLAQLMQARAVQIGFEWSRVGQPRCMGALVWQLNEPWAAFSWSLIDSAGRPRPAYFAAQGACAPRLLTIQPIDGEPCVCRVNDSPSPLRGPIRVRRMTFDGKVLAESRILFPKTSVDSVTRYEPLTALVGVPTDPTREFVVADHPPQRAIWFYARDRVLRYPVPDFACEPFTSASGQARIRLTAQTLIRDARWIMQSPAQPLLTLLPGETVDISEPAQTGHHPAALLLPRERPALLCANWFGAGPQPR